MAELSEIFMYDLPTFVFVWGSIAALVVSALAASFMVRQKQRRARRTTHDVRAPHAAGRALWLTD